VQQYPPNWITAALAAADLSITPGSLAIMRAWAKSTPISAYANNPIGMPAGTLGANPYAGTRYAAFTSMAGFYAAFASFMESYQGGRVHNAMLAQYPYGAAWREISNLNWPASQTETDYPSALLDLTTQAYRDSVKATPVPDRKTSGTVGTPSHVKRQVIEQARMTANAVLALNAADAALTYTLRRNRGNR
jgi:hypothetical protein